MKVGDLVVRRGAGSPVLGIVVRIFNLKGLPAGPLASLPMVELLTREGLRTWKRRKVRMIEDWEVVSEDR